MDLYIFLITRIEFLFHVLVYFNLSMLLLQYWLTSFCNLIQTLVTPGVYSTTYKRSCLEIKKSAPHSLSGLYDILVDNTVITVYCEMAKEGGGFTFIPREAVKQGKLPNLINQIFTEKSKVLLRFQNKNGLQPFTLITQLSGYERQPLGVLMHSYSGYTRPLNVGLGDYIFLGVLPASIAKARTIQGFRY